MNLCEEVNKSLFECKKQVVLMVEYYYNDEPEKIYKMLMKERLYEVYEGDPNITIKSRSEPFVQVTKDI
jgi:hypothetical protein